MSHSRTFQNVEEACDYFYALSYDSENGECISICQLPPEESGCLSDEEDINEDIFVPVLPVYDCGEIEKSTKIHSNEIFGPFETLKAHLVPKYLQILRRDRE
ncbi:hypothetical protein NPIL_443091 [Nephila pilipes]|uniref:Uncharacterized protein n=1 Tax=Nephila pilipes TaxID=299642 RepID=A0A8X6NLV9_NEPPI|nr:hypothetical protein NPIL_443091 [Nephila pilipes]